MENIKRNTALAQTMENKAEIKLVNLFKLLEHKKIITYDEWIEWVEKPFEEQFKRDKEEYIQCEKENK